ncbi:hypothetical protein [Shewanella salipaludis]|uniref:Tetratricopeptide repeat protein n=1 Tax=Shewanella salipaludis TaxID=2723052 RepID=A0A972FSE4_9GAMM|nr:hypothetical protein [Shewanella salipaludis]NMH64827.1 hypothetical protein [Shewanella salipaludis]
MQRIRLMLPALTLSLAMLSAPGFGLTQKEANNLFSKKHYAELVSQIDAQASIELYAVKLMALVEQDELDDAEQLTQQYLSKRAEAPLVLKMAGDVYAAMAQHTSIFSALGYAKQARHNYEQAYRLAPATPQIADALFSFYLYAPGMAGGDADKALAVAQALRDSAPREGALALLQYYAKEDKREAFDALLLETKQAFPQDLSLALIEARQFEDKPERAIAILSRAKDYPAATEEQTGLLADVYYQLGKYCAKSGSQTELGIISLQRLMTGGDSVQWDKYQGWAQLRMAQLLLAKGELSQAKTWANQALSISDDGSLTKAAKKILKKKQV